ncbi:MULTISPECIES: DUF4389 domain-containing protein [Streptomyces]|uniref:DUF4389 domain-containing protein n=1 Tax=Streptomyces dengpaensis TaxID=2049881 RepID=A0ABM6SNG7_9ACTN|nr:MULTISPECIES: DUF4389 domain-containing protein [Streptomyces]AVH55870.1 DUF4389 domain-containing protein [Streptomyces dengpaensis]PIB12121.1 hypothetical protein B1C81_02840 [Streptomyces sp. HG99]
MVTVTTALSDYPKSPVTLEAEYDPGLSRWLWLVKWLLALPHYVILVILWAAFLIVTVIAFFAILITGAYPRALFGFNVGVMRWSWRVAYYAYGTLGTDRYPPFTLADVPGYPAHLEIVHPERLSRGLVLVKWWLLVLPQLLVAAFLGGGVRFAGGLAGLLAFYAGVSLLFTGRYPRGMYDLNIGLHRWTARVMAYAALLTDVYPPYRLDQGPREP